MTKTIVERAQGVANALSDHESICAAENVSQPVRDSLALLHDKLNRLRLAFGIELVEPESLRSGAIAFSGGGSKDPPPPPGGA